jgi:hypothetical protein
LEAGTQRSQKGRIVSVGLSLGAKREVLEQMAP